MTKRPGAGMWCGFSLRESLLAGFCAASIMLAEQFLHIPLHLPGHRVLPLAFFLLLVRACVRPPWAASLTGLLAGIMALSFGMGHGGPIQVMKFLVAGIIADLASLALPLVTRSLPFGFLAGAMVGASWVPLSLLEDRLVGMGMSLALGHSLIKASSAAAFGAVGGALVPGVARRLRATGLLHGVRTSTADRQPDAVDGEITQQSSSTAAGGDTAPPNPA